MITLDSSLSVLPQLNCAWTIIRQVSVAESSAELKAEFQSVERQVVAALTIENLSADPGVAESRLAFRALGLDPARYRPSQEALLRRLISGKGMYWINSGVDLNNLLSVKYRVPMGLYDLDRIQGETVLKVGKASDVYDALNGRPIQCDQKLILCDQVGPFGSPYVDSVRTSVTPETKNFLHVVYFCYKGLGPEAFVDMAQSFVRYHGGVAEKYKKEGGTF